MGNSRKKNVHKCGTRSRIVANPQRLRWILTVSAKQKEEDIKFRCTPEMRAELEKIASERGEPLSSVVREAIRLYLDSVRIKQATEAGAIAASRKTRRE